MPRLLISVRNVDEARHALIGEADLIDVKEPLRGSLGQAVPSVISAIASAIGARRPVSAALGELLEPSGGIPPANLTYVKWGLSGCGARNDWLTILAERSAAVCRANPGCQLVVVAYADWQRSGAPRPAAICQAAVKLGCGAVLIDTFHKDGTNLLDWLPPKELRAIRTRCRSFGLQLALAGGIDFELLPTALEIDPDWIAVRGAACLKGRTGVLCPERVARLAEIIHAGSSGVAPAMTIHKPAPFVSGAAIQRSHISKLRAD